MNRILVEVLTGKEPATPDDDEQAKFRAEMRVEADKAKAGGYTIQIPGE